MTFRTFVHGIPKGQPRPRAFVRGNKAAVYDPGTAEGWKSCIAAECQSLRGARLDTALTVNLTFHMPRPKSHYKTSGGLKPNAPLAFAQKPDADNLAKAVLDALTQISAWVDDSQVVELCINKRWADATPAGCVVEIIS